MKYAQKYVTFSSLAALFFTASAFCMEPEKEVVIFKEKSAEVLSLVLAERIDFFNHHDICSIGSVDRACNKFVLQTAPKRRQFINGFVNFSAAVKISQVWHKYGSAYGYVDKDIDGIDVRDFKLRYCLECRILECDGETSFRSGKYQQNAELIENFKQPKFNEAGDVYSYYIYPAENKVVELSLSESNYYRPCGLRYVSGQQLCRYNLCDCVGFPDFLKALLNSSFVEEVLTEEPWKVFNLEDAIIPDDYYYSSMALPESLQNAIAQRYREQQQRKEKKSPSFLPMALVEFLATHPAEQRSQS